MNNTTACSAENLSFLQPAVIKGVVGESAFQSGTQYVTENRVKIFDADDQYVASIVIGQFGHDQTQAIRLSDGKLLTTCSCVLDEQPFCRHCVAALLAYQGWAAEHSATRRIPEQLGAIIDADLETVESAISFGEMTLFVDWLQPVFQAIAHGDKLPRPPKLSHRTVLGWAQTVQALVHHQRENESVQSMLRAELDSCSSKIDDLSAQLRTARGEARDAQSAHRGLLEKLPGLARRLETQESQMKGLIAELTRKAAQFDGVANSCKEIAAAIQAATDKSAEREAA